MMARDKLFAFPPCRSETATWVGNPKSQAESKSAAAVVESSAATIVETA